MSESFYQENDIARDVRQPECHSTAVTKDGPNAGSSLLVLPTFVASRTDPRPGEFLRDFWSVQESGNWSRDIATGRAHAREALRFMHEERAPHVLNWIASEMIQKRHFGPIEVGFFHELGAIMLRAGRGRR